MSEEDVFYECEKEAETSGEEKFYSESEIINIDGKEIIYRNYNEHSTPLNKADPTVRENVAKTNASIVEVETNRQKDDFAVDKSADFIGEKSLLKDDPVLNEIKKGYDEVVSVGNLIEYVEEIKEEEFVPWYVAPTLKMKDSFLSAVEHVIDEIAISAPVSIYFNPFLMPDLNFIDNVGEKTPAYKQNYYGSYGDNMYFFADPMLPSGLVVVRAFDKEVRVIKQRRL